MFTKLYVGTWAICCAGTVWYIGLADVSEKWVSNATLILFLTGLLGFGLMVRVWALQEDQEDTEIGPGNDYE